MKIVIIGGGTAGSEVAWRLRQQNKEIEILILEKGGYPQYSPCALPYLISGEIKNPRDIFLFDLNFYSYNKIILELGVELKKIDKQKKQVYYKKEGEEKTADYDRLVIAVGAKPKVPSISGLKDCQYFTLRNFDEAKEIKKIVKSRQKALIIGSGYIGIELADALRLKGLEVILLELQNRILPNTLDQEISGKIKEYLEVKGVKVITEAKISRLSAKKAKINDKIFSYDHLFLCCGLSADLKLALEADLKCGEGIIVDQQGRTSDKNIYACGDAVQSINLIDEKKVFSQLATTAVRQARVVADNILGKKIKNEAVLSASISKFGSFAFGSCGVSQEYCQKNKIKTVSAFYSGQTKAEYYPSAGDIFIKIIASDQGKIIGCQIAGPEEVGGRINLISLAMKKGLFLEEFILSETCYNPALSPIFDPLILAAEICLKKLKAKNGAS